jgi:hypothetical protein
LALAWRYHSPSESGIEVRWLDTQSGHRIQYLGLPQADEGPTLLSPDNSSLLVLFSDSDGTPRVGNIGQDGLLVGTPSRIGASGARFEMSITSTTNGLYLGWREPSSVAGNFDDIVVQKVVWNGITLDGGTNQQFLVPGRMTGDQTVPRLAPLPYRPNGGLFIAWNDVEFRAGTTEKSHGDVFASIRLLPNMD